MSIEKCGLPFFVWPDGDTLRCSDGVMYEVKTPTFKVRVCQDHLAAAIEKADEPKVVVKKTGDLR